MPKTKPIDVCQVRCFNTDLVAQVRDALPDDEAFEIAQTLFTALADKSRLKILHALKDAQELCVCDIAAVLGVQISAASHHLRKLRDLKLLKYRNDGKLVYYSLRDEFVSQVLSHVFTKHD
ncbi:transcriptional regulator, ArsR family [Gloeocapsa sp. PCC 7428]|uniref:ArsR/SmtB family transcription factor n=1 Tax=Gloeocapsa sp. PCC 7428 TaxID=1173026 RepID=UPI0002A5C7A2|nr:metalloregulator ArsR/SmtB family transcription factor [Gloeocapsa sp. PCC 7428]AFZ32856.1 transcriptional regulator, ArsR family [Gloeocapsa sp. PCC 7428]